MAHNIMIQYNINRSDPILRSVRWNFWPWN